MPAPGGERRGAQGPRLAAETIGRSGARPGQASAAGLLPAADRTTPAPNLPTSRPCCGRSASRSFSPRWVLRCCTAVPLRGEDESSRVG